MAHMDPLDLALMDGAGDAVKGVADDPVAPLYAGCLQRFDQYVGYPFSHREPRVFIGYVSALTSRPADLRCRARTRPSRKEHMPKCRLSAWDPLSLAESR